MTRSILRCVCVLLIVASSERALAGFNGPAVFTAGTDPRSVAVGDLNGDGRDDMVVANWQSASVSVFINTTAPGATTPTFAAKVDFATATAPLAVTIVDLNGDGKRDLAVGNLLSASVSILRNTTGLGSTTPAFDTKQDFATLGNPEAIAAGDVNLDGVADVVVACNAGPNYAVVLRNTTLRGATTFTFAPHQDFQVIAAYGIAIADLNGDGVPDIVTSSAAPADVSVLRNTSAPGATTLSFATSQPFATADGAWGVAIGDINGDGKLDIVVACVGTGVSSYFSVLLNNTAAGATTFAFGLHYDVGTLLKGQSVVLRDFDGDGKLDVAVTGLGYPAVSVFTNATPTGGSLFFPGRSDYTVGYSPIFVTAGDFNGDGRPDLAVANSSATIDGNSGANGAEVLLNTTSFTRALYFTTRQNSTTLSTPGDVATGDFNGDGKTDIAIVEYLNAKASVLLNTTTPGATAATFGTRQDFNAGFGTGVVRVADLNSDGRPDIATVNFSASSISLLRNTTTPGSTVPAFAAKQDVVTGTPGFDTSDVEVEDVNADGKPDLIVANTASNTIGVLINQTSPGATSFTFAASVPLADGAGPTSVAVGDVNGDGKPDFVVVNTSPTGLSVFLNTTTPGGSPTFASPVNFAIDTFSYVASLGDLNGDGKPDIAAVSQSVNAIEILRNTTAPGAAMPSFAAHQDFATAVGPSGHLVMTDLNDDGKLDLATADMSSNVVSVLLNNTSPGATTFAFLSRTDLSTDSSPNGAAAADFNGDGFADVVAVNGGASTASVFMRTVPKNVFVSSGDNQVKAFNTAFAPLKAVVKDASAVPVQFASVTYVPVAGGGGASGTFSGSTTVVSDRDGIATAPTLTANTTAGSFTVTATGPDAFGAVATFNLTNAIPAPGNVVATAASTLPVSVSITWAASPYGNAFDVWRYDFFPVSFTPVASNLHALTFTDNLASADKAYIYGVRVTSPDPSLFGDDLATTVIFTDTTLTAGSTKVKAVHLTQLQTAVHAVESVLGRPQTVFSSIGTGVVISANHLTELRTALDAARAATSFLAPALYMNPPPVHGTLIRADDVRDLRLGVK